MSDLVREEIESFFKGVIVDGISRNLQFLENPEEGRIEVDLVAPSLEGKEVPTVHLNFPADKFE